MRDISLNCFTSSSSSSLSQLHTQFVLALLFATSS
jgi:hypothetical protein